MFSTFIQRKKLWTMDIILTVKDLTFVLLLFIVHTSCINCSSFCHSQTPAEQAQARMQMALKAAGMQIVNACTSTTVTASTLIVNSHLSEVSFVTEVSKCFMNLSDITSYVSMYQV